MPTPLLEPLRGLLNLFKGGQRTSTVFMDDDRIQCAISPLSFGAHPNAPLTKVYHAQANSYSAISLERVERAKTRPCGLSFIVLLTTFLTGWKTLRCAGEHGRFAGDVNDGW